MNKRAYLNLVRGFAIYDIIALAPFALPWTAVVQLAVFGRIQQALNLPGTPIDTLDPNELVFFNMLGIVGVGWSIWRLRNLTVELGIFEGWLRGLFAAVLLYGGLINGGSALLILFGVIDLIAAPLHLFGFRPK